MPATPPLNLKLLYVRSVSGVNSRNRLGVQRKHAWSFGWNRSFTSYWFPGRSAGTSKGGEAGASHLISSQAGAWEPECLSAAELSTWWSACVEIPYLRKTCLCTTLPPCQARSLPSIQAHNRGVSRPLICLQASALRRLA